MSRFKETKTDALLDEIAQRLCVIEDRLDKLNGSTSLLCDLVDAVRKIVVLFLPFPDAKNHQSNE